MRGILFSAGLFAVAFSILVLGIIALDSAQEFQRVNSRALVFERMRNELDYVGGGYGGILSDYVAISVTNASVVFEERLPASNPNGFRSSAALFRDFVVNKSVFNLRIDLAEINSTLPVVMWPYNATYTHPDGFGGTELVVNGGAYANRYSIDFLISGNADVSVACSCSAGADTLEIYAVSSNESISFVQPVDFASASSVTVSVDGAEIEVDVSNDVLGIESEGGVNLDVVTRVYFNETRGIFLTFPEQTINISSPEYNINVSSAIRIG